MTSCRLRTSSSRAERMAAESVIWTAATGPTSMSEGFARPRWPTVTRSRRGTPCSVWAFCVRANQLSPRYGWRNRSKPSYPQAKQIGSVRWFRFTCRSSRVKRRSSRFAPCCSFGPVPSETCRRGMSRDYSHGSAPGKPSRSAVPRAGQARSSVRIPAFPLSTSRFPATNTRAGCEISTAATGPSSTEIEFLKPYSAMATKSSPARRSLT